MSYLFLNFNGNDEFKTSDKGEIVFFDQENQPIEYIPEFNKINLFVGQNNSGKSKLLRGILKSNRYFISDKDFFASLKDFGEALNELAGKISSNTLKGSPQYTTMEVSHQYQKYLNEGFKLVAAPSAKGLIPESLKVAVETVNNFSIRLIQGQVTEDDIEKLKLIAILLKLLSQASNRGHNPQGSAPSHQYITIETFRFQYANNLTNLLAGFKGEITELNNLFDSIIKLIPSYVIPPRKIFVPTLRTTHALYRGNVSAPQKDDDDIFRTSVYTNYSFNKEEHLDRQKIVIHTGLNLYKEMRETRGGHDEQRDSHQSFVEFIRKHFFQNYAKLEIVAIDTQTMAEQHIEVRFGREKGRPIHYLGDGINSLINLLYPIFTAPANSWIFIEEPELHLHPGMQRICINELISNAELEKKNLTYFITTHSNHLLDISADTTKVSIYTFSKVKENHHLVKNVKNKDVSILTELGAQNSSVYLANCTIWVEGVTDRMYLSKYLECYIDHKQREDMKTRSFDEDMHYAYFLYGGSNIVHYIFTEEVPEPDEEQKNEIEKIKARFLSNHILLLADKDEKKQKRHELFTDQTSQIFLYEVLKVREIENLLSTDFLLKHLHLVTKSVSAEDIGKMTIDKEKLKTEYLGRYILSCAEEAKIAFPKSFQGESGTVNPMTYKKLLAEVAYQNITWDLMTSEAQQLAEKIYDFIASNNS